METVQPRARFLRRTGAWLVDAFVVALIFQVVGVAAFALTGGRIQTSVGLMGSTMCEGTSTIPAGIEIPPDLRPNFAAECSYAVWGMPAKRYLTVGRQTRGPGGTVTTMARNFPLGAQGQATAPFDIGFAAGPFFLLMRWWGDRRAGSPGRRLLRIRVVRASSDRPEAPSSSALTKRYLVFAAPAVVTAIAILGLAAWAGVAIFDNTATYSAFLVILALGALAYLLPAGAIAQGEDTYYDRAAGTMVVVRPPKAADGAAAGASSAPA